MRKIVKLTILALEQHLNYFEDIDDCIKIISQDMSYPSSLD